MSLAAVLALSALGHLASPYRFLDAVYAYRLVGLDGGAWVAAVLPFAQLVAAVGLLMRWLPNGCYLLTVVMGAGFVAAQAVTLNRGLDISCGCFGNAEGEKVGWRTLARAAGCLLAALVGWACLNANGGDADAPGNVAG